MDYHEWIAFGFLLIGFIAQAVALVQHANNKRERLVTYIEDKFNNMNAVCEGRRDVCQSHFEIKLDKEKTEMVSKDVCTVRTKEIREDIQEIKKKVEIIPAIDANLKMLLRKNGI